MLLRNLKLEVIECHVKKNKLLYSVRPIFLEREPRTLLNAITGPN